MSVMPERIEVDGDLVIFTWDDGGSSRFSAADLRAACQCASCREPSGMAATSAVLSGPDRVTITDARLVGGYAVAFTFAPDGHGTGIYPFERLHSMPPGEGTHG
jgi:DUF971 family protein